MALGLVQIFRSTDTGAPTLSGVVGQMITVLDALLINGYNSQTVTSITRSGSTATVTKTAHGFVLGQVVNHSGAAQSEYNINAKITNVAANTYDYTVSGTPVTPATGTVTAKVAPLGFTSTVSATNIKSYIQPSGTNGFCLIANDTLTTSVHLRGAESCSAITNFNTRTTVNEFPTTTQSADPTSSGGSNGTSYFQKSSTASATARSWVCHSDGKIFHFINRGGGQVFDEASFTFGDFPSFKSGDIYNTILLAANTAGSGQSTNAVLFGGNATTLCGYFARSYSAAAGSVNAFKYNHMLLSSMSGISTAGTILSFPNEADSAMWLLPVYLFEASNPTKLRGRLPGVWWVWNNLSTGTPADLDTLTATVGTVSRNLEFRRGGTGATAGAFMETSNTWSSN